MDDKILVAEKRGETLGTADSKRLRRAGKIPAVIYGKNAPVHIALNAKTFSEQMHHFTESTLLTLKVGKKNYTVLMKDFQELVMYDKIMHVDFFEITRGEALRTHVPVTLVNSPKGVREGGILSQALHEVEVECLPKDMPEHLTIDIANLGLNESLHVSEMVVPAGVKILTAKDQVIVSVTTQKSEKVTEAADVSEDVED